MTDPEESIVDVAVIGGGPAGATVAATLAGRGHRVMLIDRDEFPRPKVCGCCLADRGVGVLRDLGLHSLIARGLTLDEVEVGAGGRHLRLPFPGSLVLSREDLDTSLVEHARAVGVTVRTRTRAMVGPDRIVRTRDLDHGREHAINARFIVAADGLDGRSLDALPGFAWRISSGSRFGAGTTIPASSVPGDGPPPGRLDMLANRSGYVGLVRLPSGDLDLAAAFDNRAIRELGGPAGAAASILQRQNRPLLAALARGLKWRGTPRLTRRRVVADDRIACVGDAAGYVEPFTGEGMSWALGTATPLADMIDRAILENGTLDGWRRTHAGLVGGDRRRCRLVAQAVRMPGLAHAAIRVASVAPFIRRRLADAASGGRRSSPGDLIGGRS